MSLLKNLDEFDRTGQPGDWFFTEHDEYLVIRLPVPDADHDTAALRVKPYTDGDRPLASAVWDWDGNREAPTLSPSILHHSNPEWHGYLRAGVLVQA